MIGAGGSWILVAAAALHLILRVEAGETGKEITISGTLPPNVADPGGHRFRRLS